MPARGVERWLTQRLSHRLGVGARGGDGVCAGVDFVTPHSLVSMLLGKDADDPWESRPARLAAARASSTTSWAPPGFDDLTDAPRPRRPDRRPLHPPLRRGPPPGRPVLFLRRPASRSSSPTGASGLDTDGAGRRPRPRPALAGRAVAPTASAGSSAPATRRTPRRHDGATPRRGRRPRPAAAAVALRPHPAPGDRGRAAASARRAARRPPLAAAGLARPVGARWSRPPAAGQVARAADGSSERGRPSAARLPGTRLARAAPHARRAPRCTPSRHRPCRRHPARLAPARPARQHRARCRSPVLPRDQRRRRCRCTPATVRPVRSTCSGRCWSACWRTTRRSSRATSS